MFFSPTVVRMDPADDATMQRTAARLRRALVRRMHSGGEQASDRTNGADGSLRLPPSSTTARDEAKEKAAAEKR